MDCGFASVRDINSLIFSSRIESGCAGSCD